MWDAGEKKGVAVWGHGSATEGVGADRRNRTEEEKTIRLREGLGVLGESRNDWPCSSRDTIGMSLPLLGLGLSPAETVPSALTSISGMRYFPSLIDRYFCVKNLQQSPQHREDSDFMEQFQRRLRCSKY